MPEAGLAGYGDLMKRFEALRSGKASRLILGQLGELAVQRAREIVPRKTRNLQRTIRVDSVDEQQQTVRIVAGGMSKGVEVGYAAAVEFGSGPHVIRAKRAKALAWGGARRLSGSLRTGSKPEFFARSVHHPGTRARPYLFPGARKALQEVGLANIVIQVWNAAA